MRQQRQPAFQTTEDFMRKMRSSYKSQWKRMKKRKKRSRRSTPSSTAGSTKGENCKATRWDRFCAGYSRAARPQYAPEYQAFLKRKKG